MTDTIHSRTAAKVVCTLTHRELRARGVRWKELLRRSAGTEPAANGVTIAFDDASVRAELERLIGQERQCCTWMYLDLCEREGRLMLTIRANSDQGIAAIHAMVGVYTLESPRNTARVFVVARFMRGFFLDDAGKLQPLLRAALFWAVGNFILLPYFFEKAVIWLAVALHLPEGFSAQVIFLYELGLSVMAALLTGVFAAYERRRIDSYGLPLREAFGRLFWEGVVVGFVMPAIVALGMLALGGMQVHGVALSGTTLIVAALWWLLANLVVGLGEELWYRGYLLQTLWKSVGFWPAAILLAILFASDHYFYKPGENLYDVASLVGFNLLVCYSVLKTGSLWFGVGMHAAFDFTQLFLIGTRNGNRVPVDRLLDVTFHGPAWLTGGALGTEASVLLYPLLLAAFAYVAVRFRRPTRESAPPLR